MIHVVAFLLCTIGQADPPALTLLDFSMQGCPPCRQLEPEIASLERSGFPVRKIRLEADRETCEKYGVSAFPTLILIDRDGAVIDRKTGFRTAEQISAWYNAQVHNRPHANESEKPAAPRAPPVDDGSTELTSIDGTPKSMIVSPPEGDEDPKPEVARDGKCHHDKCPYSACPTHGPNVDTPGCEHCHGWTIAHSDRKSRRAAAGEPASPEASPPRTQEPKSPENPDPKTTVGRIRVIKARTTGFGSGTVISSDANRSIVLTCSHVFEGAGRTPTIKFDLSGQTHDGTLILHDPGLDVGLFSIAPGRVIPASPVVEPAWKPQARTGFYVFGFAEGKPSQSTRVVLTKTETGGIDGMPNYIAIECSGTPHEGVSGGGLFTGDRYIAGVCNFAEPQGNHGLYAHPRSIYSVLDRAGLASLYGGTQTRSMGLLAAGKPRPKTAAEANAGNPELEAACLNIFRRWHKPGPVGPVGPTGATGATGAQGPIGLTGATGANGTNGVDGTNGKDGVDGKDGKDGTGTAFDPTAILARLSALEAEVAKPLTVRIKMPGGAIAEHDFAPAKNTDGKTGIGAGFPNRYLNIDLSDFAVTKKSPTPK